MKKSSTLVNILRESETVPELIQALTKLSKNKLLLSVTEKFIRGNQNISEYIYSVCLRESHKLCVRKNYVCSQI